MGKSDIKKAEKIMKSSACDSDCKACPIDIMCKECLGKAELTKSDLATIWISGRKRTAR